MEMRSIPGGPGIHVGEAVLVTSFSLERLIGVPRLIKLFVTTLNRLCYRDTSWLC